MESPEEEKQEQLRIIKKLLLAPIESVWAVGPVSVKELPDYEGSGSCNCIVSHQTYRPESQRQKPYDPDPDMSDFAVGFYECVYREILQEQGILTETEGSSGSSRFAEFRDPSRFAGDTMNSFNTAAWSLRRIGTATTRRPGGTDYDRSEWPDDLEYAKTYSRHYHCLANFWLLPMGLGRGPRKGGTDYMYHFLPDVVGLFASKDPSLEAKYSEYSEYFEAFKDLDNFIHVHAIDCYFKSPGLVYEPGGSGNPKKAAEEFFKDYAPRMIRERADLLAERYLETLWDYFNEGPLKRLIEQVDSLPDFPGCSTQG